MTIDLTPTELSLIDKALNAYEKEAGGNAMFTGMLGMMLMPKEQRDQEKQLFKDSMNEAERETQQRRIEATLLRAKVYQAQARQSEHVLET